MPVKLSEKNLLCAIILLIAAVMITLNILVTRNPVQISEKVLIWGVVAAVCLIIAIKTLLKGIKKV